MAEPAKEATDSVPTENQSVPAASVELKDKRRYSIIPGLIGLILVLAITGLGYFSWQQMKRIDGLLAELAVHDDSITTLSLQLANQQQDLELSESNSASSEILINQQNARLDSLTQELAALRLGINSSAGSDRLVQLNEAASLMRLAQRYLLEGRELEITRNLYQQSHNLLSRIEDPAVNRITELVRSDLTVLNNTRAVDVSGLFLRLTELADEMSMIRFGPELEPSDEFRNADSTLSSATDGIMSGLGNFFRRYFTIRRLDEPPRLPLNPEQISFLQQTILLQIEQAKLALLLGREEIYLDSVSEVYRLSEQNIADSVGSKANILRSLQQLQTENINLERPPLSNALGLLESLLLDTNEQGGAQ